MSEKSNLTNKLDNQNEESSVSLKLSSTNIKKSKDNNYYKQFFFDVKNILFPENDKNTKNSIRTQIIDKIRSLSETQIEDEKYKKENINFTNNYNRGNLIPTKKYQGKEYIKYKRVNSSLTKIKNLIKYNLLNTSKKITKNNYNQNKYRNINSIFNNYLNRRSNSNNLYPINLKYNSMGSKYNNNRLKFNY